MGGDENGEPDAGRYDGGSECGECGGDAAGAKAGRMSAVMIRTHIDSDQMTEFGGAGFSCSVALPFD